MAGKIHRAPLHVRPTGCVRCPRVHELRVQRRRQVHQLHRRLRCGPTRGQHPGVHRLCRLVVQHHWYCSLSTCQASEAYTTFQLLAPAAAICSALIVLPPLHLLPQGLGAMFGILAAIGGPVLKPGTLAYTLIMLQAQLAKLPGQLVSLFHTFTLGLFKGK